MRQPLSFYGQINAYNSIGCGAGSRVGGSIASPPPMCSIESSLSKNSRAKLAIE